MREPHGKGLARRVHEKQQDEDHKLVVAFENREVREPSPQFSAGAAAAS